MQTKEPNHTSVIKQLSLLSQQARPDDIFIFYFPGHTAIDEKVDRSFLLARKNDSNTTDTLELSAIPVEKVTEILPHTKGQQLRTFDEAYCNNPGRVDEGIRIIR